MSQPAMVSSSEQTLTADNDMSIPYKTFSVEDLSPIVRVKRSDNARRIRRTLIITLAIDVLIPIGVYFLLEQFISLVWALFCAGIPPLLGAIYKFIRTRRVDLLGIVIVIGVFISFMLTLVSQSPVFLLLRESAMTGFKGVVDLLSLIPIHVGQFTVRPLMFYIARALMPHAPIILLDETRRDWYDYCWETMPRFRRHFILITFVWGLALLIEFGARLAMIFLIPDVNKVVIFSAVLITIWLGGLSLVTLWWGRMVKRHANEDFVKLELEGREASEEEWEVIGW